MAEKSKGFQAGIAPLVLQDQAELRNLQGCISESTIYVSTTQPLSRDPCLRLGTVQKGQSHIITLRIPLSVPTLVTPSSLKAAGNDFSRTCTQPAQQVLACWHVGPEGIAYMTRWLMYITCRASRKWLFACLETWPGADALPTVRQRISSPSCCANTSGSRTFSEVIFWLGC